MQEDNGTVRFSDWYDDPEEAARITERLSPEQQEAGERTRARTRKREREIK
jgi:hypothetical protein